MAAVSAGGISEAISKASVSAREAGMSIDELIASVSVIGETTQQSMDSVGNAMKTLLARYGNVKAGVFTSMGLNDDGDTSENINDIEKVLSKLGIRMRSSATEIRSITDVLDEVAEKWDTLDDVSRGALGTAFAGTRQREQFNILMSQWDRVKELTEESANAAGTADEKYTAYMDSMEAATKRLQNAWEGFAQSLEVSPVMKFLTNTTAGLVENLETLLKYGGTLLAALNSAKIVSAFAQGGAVGGFWGLIKELPIVGDLFKFNDNVKRIADDVATIKNNQVTETKAGVKGEGRFSRFIKSMTGKQDFVDPETGKTMSYKDVKEYKLFRGALEDIDPEKEKFVKFLSKRRGANAGIGAATTFLTQVFTNKNIGAQSGGVSGLLSKAILGSDNEQLVEETVGDTAMRVGLSTGFAALGGAWLGPLGAMLGNVVGEGFAGMFSTWFHRDELEMKQRVADAKENLKALNTINTSVLDNSSLMEKKFLDSSDITSLSKYVDELSEKLRDLSGDSLQRFLKSLNTASGQVFETVSDLSNYILNADSKERREIQREIQRGIAQENLDQLIASQEEERSKNTGVISAALKLSSPYSLSGSKSSVLQNKDIENIENYASFLNKETKFISGVGNVIFSDTLQMKGNTANELLKNAKEIQKIFDDINMSRLSRADRGSLERGKKDIDDYIKALREAITSQDKLDAEVMQSRVQIAFLNSNLHDLTQSELQGLTIDGVAGKVIKSLEQMGVAVRDASGKVKDDYLTQIELAIKKDKDLYSQLQVDTKSIGELMEIRNKFIEQFGDNYDEVREKFDSGDEEFKDITEDVERLVYSANPERIKQFALAWNIATTEVEAFAKKFPNLNAATGLMSLDEIKDKYTKIAEIFNDISKDKTLSIENLQNILENYPEYLGKIGDYEKLMGALISSIGEESAEAYKNALFSNIMTSEAYFEEFKKDLSDSDILKIERAGAKSFEDIYTLSQNNKSLEEIVDALDKYLEKVIEVEDQGPLKDFISDIKIGLLDEEINNLNEQKEALSKINDERKKELEYIKAKIALEDARKEKKRVYVQGVGWTYVADDTAISEAKEKVDSLDIERQQEGLQYQIDSLEQQKEILDAIKNNEDLKKIAEALGANGISTDTEDIVNMLASSLKIDLGDRTKSFKQAVKERNVGLAEAVDEADKKYSALVQDFQRNFGNLSDAERKNKKDEINLAYEKYKEAYEEASSFGIDLSEQSENGKIKSNVTEDPKYTTTKSAVLQELATKTDAGWSITYGGRTYVLKAKEDLSERFGMKDGQAIMHSSLNRVDPNAKIGDVVYYNGNLFVRTRDGGWGSLYTKDSDNGTAAALGEAIAGSNSFAKGTLSTEGGQSLINELGTEAIITPNGTVTALPSKTGIVPADITKNLWSLGEIAPTLVASLKSLTQKPISGNVGNTTYEEGQYFDHFVMNVYPTKDYDMDKLLREARAKANLTKHNN